MTTASALTPAAFVAVVGQDNVHAAGDVDVIQGAAPSLVVEPGDELEVAAVLAECSRQGLKVVVRGGGTRLEWGAPPRSCDVVLSTRRLDSLVEHEPGDLICVAGAGMTLSNLQQALAGAEGHRQRLMLDPPGADAGASLGGIVATGASGPLRTRFGGVRDVIIGVRFVLADGTVGHAGGKVVKNVAGYDIGKLLVGSLGTLAVITQVAFRLHPVQPATRTVVTQDTAPTALAAFVAALRELPVTPSCVDILWPEGVCIVRVDSSEEGAARQAQFITDRLGGRMLGEAEAETAAEQLRVRPWDGEGAIAGVAVPRLRLAGLLEIAGKHVEELVLRAPLGVGEARLAADPGRVQALREAVTRLGGHLVLRRAAASLAGEVWPRAGGPELELMRSVKRTLDPAGILSPGRQLGGI